MTQDNPADVARELRALSTRLENVLVPAKVVQGWQEPLTWARSTYKARRIRDEIFKDALFAEPSWDIMLDLYAAHLEDRRISISSACMASGVPPTTALRHIDILVRRGLLIRTRCERDSRRVNVNVSEHTVAAMSAMYLKLRTMADKLPGSGQTPS